MDRNVGIARNNNFPLPFIPLHNRSQISSNVLINNELCLALPPNLSINELNNYANNDSEIQYLLQITKELNLQIKRNRKRLSKSKGHVKIKTESSYTNSSELKNINFKNIPESEEINLKDNTLVNFNEMVCVKPEMNESTNSNEIEIHNSNKLKYLMRDSWLNIQDGSEELNSKEIYFSLVNVVQNLEKKKLLSADEYDLEDLRKLGIKIESKAKIRKNNTKLLNSNSNKLHFENYCDEETVKVGLEAGTMFKTILRINAKNPNEAFVSISTDNKDIFINGIRDRNRALDGDEVIVMLYPDSERPTLNNSLTQKSGKVVYILKKNHPRTVVGSFKRNERSSLLRPKDRKLPKLKIIDKDENYKFNCNEWKGYLFLAKIVSWSNIEHAEGTLVRKIGNLYDVNAIRECILLENSLNVEPFLDADKYLPSKLFIIEDEEIKKRIDIRDCCIFTIDPEGATDLDDALSCVKLLNSNFEVGIHISDVSHYLLPDTPLDKDVCEKAITVYLVDHVFHMLPKKLCEACSLSPGKDRLTFSVFVEFNSEAKIIDFRFSKSIIRSCAQFTYNQVQKIISGKNHLSNSESFPQVTNGFSLNDCAAVILNLHYLATKIRNQRFLDGALKIEQPKITFCFSDNNLPLSYSLHVAQESNWLIEEFMLIANILVANHLQKNCPNKAFLRRHSPPNKNSLSAVITCLEKVGIFIDTSSAGSIHQSIMQYDGFDEIGIARMVVIMNLLVKPMMRASYECLSSKVKGNVDHFWHYALNVPFYTHFTSPIRRYADIVVHRLLASSIGFKDEIEWSSEKIQSVAENCNRQKNNARKAAECSSELYLKLYLKNYGPVNTKAVVTDVKEQYFDAIELSTRMPVRINIKNVKEITFEDENDIPSLKISWKLTKTNSFQHIIQIFTIVDIKLSVYKYSVDTSSRIIATLIKPS